MREKDKLVFNQKAVPYLLIEYDHTDAQKVLPLICYLDAAMGGSFHIRYNAAITYHSLEVDEKKRSEIANAHAIMVFISSKFKNKDYFENFMNYTKFYKKQVIIVYLEKTVLSSMLQLPTRFYHYMWYGSGGLEDLKDAQEQFADELSGLKELEACFVPFSESDFLLERLERYRSLVQLPQELLPTAGRKKQIEYQVFANYEEFHPRESKKKTLTEDRFKEEDSFSEERRLRTAALNGSSSSALNLALFLAGVNKKAEAFSWFEKAAKQGSARAWYHLGFCYEHGNGISKNCIQALKCYQEGSRRNDYRAQRAYFDLKNSDSSV